MRLSLFLLCLTFLAGCSVQREVVIVPSSHIVQLTEPNEPFVSDQPGVWLSRPYYLELHRLETAVKDGRLVWREP